MNRPLYIRHERSLTSLYSDIESYAQQAKTVFIGTAGSVVQRQNAGGTRFYSHQYYDGEGKKRERYVSAPVGAPEAEAKADALRGKIIEVKALVPALRLLGREHYHIADSKTFATIASLHNHGIFLSGGTLIGSHAYGALLNHMGVRASAYRTEDIDIARSEPLAFDHASSESFLDMLRDSGVDFVAAPRLNPKEQSTSYKQAGRSRFHVDLLVPSVGADFAVVPVPELKAHATGLPFLRYLLMETQTVTLIARESCCSIRVPVPHRMALHKLLISQLRSTHSSKSAKDLDQGCVLLAAVGDSDSQAIIEAAAGIPASARRYILRTAPVVRERLSAHHQRAMESFNEAIATWKNISARKRSAARKS